MLPSVVLDIEGTISPTSFVTDRLYPYSVARLPAWIAAHRDEPDTARALDQVRQAIGEPAAGEERIIARLLDWLAADQKATPLKTLQGLIWSRGYADGDLVAPFFPDTIPALRAWKKAGHRLLVYSSGSVPAQRAWFAHSSDGDVSELISANYDTENAGPKREAGSYLAIAADIGASPAGIVFLSDVTAELDAAREAGWHTVGVRRPGEKQYAAGVGGHLEAASLAVLDLSGDAPAIRG